MGGSGQLQGLHARGCINHNITSSFEIVLQEVGDVRFIVDDQDTLLLTFLLAERGPGPLLDQWQGKAKRGAFARLTGHLDFSIVQLHQVACAADTQTGACSVQTWRLVSNCGWNEGISSRMRRLRSRASRCNSILPDSMRERSSKLLIRLTRRRALLWATLRNSCCSSVRAPTSSSVKMRSI